MTKEEKKELLDRLAQFANSLGYSVELESPMQDLVDAAKDNPEMQDSFDEDGNIVEEFRPAGDCYYLEKRIRIREGKSLSGQCSTLVHELVHALGLGGGYPFGILPSRYLELACESVTQFVTTAMGIDRSNKTIPRVIGYGFKGFLVSPVTKAYTNVLTDALELDRMFK